MTSPSAEVRSWSESPLPSLTDASTACSAAQAWITRAPDEVEPGVAAVSPSSLVVSSAYRLSDSWFWWASNELSGAERSVREPLQPVRGRAGCGRPRRPRSRRSGGRPGTPPRPPPRGPSPPSTATRSAAPRSSARCRAANPAPTSRGRTPPVSPTTRPVMRRMPASASSPARPARSVVASVGSPPPTSQRSPSTTPSRTDASVATVVRNR